MGLIIIGLAVLIALSAIESRRLQRRIDELRGRAKMEVERTCPPHKWRYAEDSGRMVCIICRKPPFPEDK